jgi:choline dehydrogenase-like flavoprotein
VHIDLDQATESRAFHATVCIIGGGIAGLILAMRLARAGVDVHLLEGGGLEFEQRSQDLYRSEMTAGNHRGSNDGRFRTFGGSSTQWGGQILPFTPDVFDPPAGSPSLGWPVGEQELIPYYDQIQSILGVDPLPFTADLLPALGHPAPPSSQLVRLRFAKWTPFKKRNLAHTVGAEALAHRSVTVFTHANAASLSVDPDDPRSIHSIRVLNNESQEFAFTAAHFVLCAGTVESSRLLLCSPSIPNPHDQIGRYFHDHVAYHAAMRIDPPARQRIIDLFGPFYVDGTIHSPRFEATPELRSRDALYSVMAHVVVLEPEDSGTAAIRNMVRSLQSGRVKEAIGTNLLPMLRGAGEVLRLILYARFKRRRAVSKRAELRINIDVEQAPNPDNRIRVSTAKIDVLGLPTTVIDWSIGAPEQDSAGRYAYVIQDYLRDLGITSIEWNQSVVNHTTPFMLDTNHAMGGLRMGTDPASSVVDPNLTFHGLDNLHIASCAVFPSGSSSNPTFTMMALTLRLADRLIAIVNTAKPTST